MGGALGKLGFDRRRVREECIKRRNKAKYAIEVDEERKTEAMLACMLLLRRRAVSARRRRRFRLLALACLGRLCDINTRIDQISQPIERRFLRYHNQDPCTFTSKFRFRQEHMAQLQRALGIPGIVELTNGSRVNGQEAFLVMLFLTATGSMRINSEEMLGFENTQLGRIKDKIIAIILENHEDKITDNLDWHMGYLTASRAAIRAKKRSLSPTRQYHVRTEDVCMLYDGWRFRIQRPGNANLPQHGHVVNVQKYFYSGYTKDHNLLFIVAATAYGLIVDLSGPYPGANNDKGALRKSELVPRFRQALEDSHLDPDHYDMLGDAIFSDGENIRALYSKTVMDNNVALKDENALDQATRAPIEHTIGKMTQNWKALMFKHDKRILTGKLADLAKACCILTNALTILNGGQPLGYFFDAANPFRLEMPTLEEYFDP